MIRIYLTFALISLLCACGDELPASATLIDPIFGAACRYTTCSDHGQCQSLPDGSPSCLCEVGYGGAACASCERGFHRDSKQRCAPDRSCVEQTSNPCGLYGSCDDQTGVIACSCDPGYEGPRCNLCANGYGRDAFGECLQLVISDGPDMDLPPGSKCTPLTCTGRGECDDSAGSVQCACDAGYGGLRCETCAAGFHEAAAQDCVIDEECRPTTCAGQGTCTDSGESLTCVCNVGYSGMRCDACALGYHRDGAQACVVDEVCDLDTCGDYGECAVNAGVATCACDPGYAGQSCADCADGYVRNSSLGICVATMCKGNPIKGPASVTFEDATTFPEYENNCVSGVAVNTAELSFTSIADDGVVWSCSANTLYGLDSKHVFVEAGSLGPAQLIFRGKIATLSFDYGARSALALQVLADGRAVGTLTAARRSKGSQSFTFSPPSMLIELRSVSGSTQQLALDNLTYSPPPCP